jgi:predicted Zn-dependent protease
LQLKPDFVPALVARADLRLRSHDAAGAGADLDGADNAAPRESNVRLLMGELYLRAGMFAPAVAQFEIWMQAHADDAHLGDALAGSCWARAMWGQDPHRALSDCNAALRQRPNGPRILEGRALSRLRLGDAEKSISDFDAVLTQQPKNAGALYGRGLAELRKGLTKRAQADMAAAAALEPNIAQQVKQRGLVP